MKSFLKFKVPMMSMGVAVSNRDLFSAVTNRRTHVHIRTI
jgi:hypothetical protein